MRAPAGERSAVLGLSNCRPPECKSLSSSLGLSLLTGDFQLRVARIDRLTTRINGSVHFSDAIPGSSAHQHKNILAAHVQYLPSQATHFSIEPVLRADLRVALTEPPTT